MQGRVKVYMRKIRLCSFLVVVILLAATVLNTATLAAGYIPPFDLQSEAIYLVNLDTGKVIFEKNADKRMYPASLTKIMTVILALEKIEDLDGVTIPLKLYIQDALYGQNASLSGILLNEEVTPRGLIYGCMLQSGNEAAMMLADYIGDGSIAHFVEMMNDKARELGCTDTNFANPNGLHDENNYTTAKDMAIITRYAMQLPEFMEIATTVTKEIGPTNKHTSLMQTTTNKMMMKGSEYYYSPIRGIKTGTLPEAGRCFVSSASKDGFTYLMVLMGAPINDPSGKAYPQMLNFIETQKIYEWAFDTFRVKTLLEKGKLVTEIPVTLSTEKDSVGLVSAERFTSLVPSDIEASSVQLLPDIPKSIQAPVSKGDEIGSVRLMLAGEEVGRVVLLANESIEMSKTLYYWEQVKGFFDSFWAKFAVIFVGLLLVLYIALMIIRNRNFRKYGTGPNSRRRRRSSRRL